MGTATLIVVLATDGNKTVIKELAGVIQVCLHTVYKYSFFQIESSSVDIFPLQIQ